MKWQTFDSAPRDGTEIIGYREDCGLLLVRFTSLSEFLTDSEIEHQYTIGATDEDVNEPDWFCADFARGCRLEDDVLPTHWMLPTSPQTQPSDEEEPSGDDEVSAADQIASLTQENEDLRIRNLELEDAVAKMQDGIRAIQQHQTKRRK